MAATAKKALVWEDKFNEPEIDALREQYPKAFRVLFDDARERILGFGEVTEELVWEGLPWRWCLRYTKPKDPTRAFVFLVPNPEKPRIGIPFTGEMLQNMPLHRLKKYMKETLVASHDVGGKFWTEFEFQSKSQLDDAMDLVKRKHNFLASDKS